MKKLTGLTLVAIGGALAYKALGTSKQRKKENISTLEGFSYLTPQEIHDSTTLPYLFVDNLNLVFVDSLTENTLLGKKVIATFEIDNGSLNEDNTKFIDVELFNEAELNPISKITKVALFKDERAVKDDYYILVEDKAYFVEFFEDDYEI